jgi:carboxynorspermidine decarboxylase
MKINLDTFEELHRPAYVLEEWRLRRNLELIARVAREADVEIILAFKAFALWKTFPIFRAYIGATTASSLYEARLGYEEFGSGVHTFSPGYTDYEIDGIARCSSHLTFNSLTQWQRLAHRVKAVNPAVSLGLRVNPEYSEVETAIYNPCAPGTRFGITADKLPERLPDGVDGFHCHCHCESGADAFERTLAHIEEKFARWFPQLKWINFGGGAPHDASRLRRAAARRDDAGLPPPPSPPARHPRAGQCLCLADGAAGGAGARRGGRPGRGPGRAQRELLVPHARLPGDALPPGGARRRDHRGRCRRLPQRRPRAVCLPPGRQLVPEWRLHGFWRFDHALQVGENIILEDMIHYTTVKTTMFNGISHPALAIVHLDGELEVLREFTTKTKARI